MLFGACFNIRIVFLYIQITIIVYIVCYKYFDKNWLEYMMISPFPGESFQFQAFYCALHCLYMEPIDGNRRDALCGSMSHL